MNKIICKDDVLRHSSKSPDNFSSGVYFLIDNDQVVYVGQTTKGLSRVLSHFEKKEFDSYYFISTPISELDSVELHNIIHHQPKYNRSLGSLGAITLWWLNEKIKKDTGIGNMRALKSFVEDNSIKSYEFRGRTYYLKEDCDYIYNFFVGGCNG